MAGFLHPIVLTVFVLQDGPVFDVLAHVCTVGNTVIWNLIYLFIAPCGDVIKASSGYLTSPGFPEDYDINRNCTWTFDSSLSPSVILLRIVYIFLTGSISDSLWITDRTQNLKVTHLYRGDFEDGDVIKVDSSVVIRFSSGSHVSSQRRFVLEYQVFPGMFFLLSTLNPDVFFEERCFRNRTGIYFYT